MIKSLIRGSILGAIVALVPQSATAAQKTAELSFSHFIPQSFILFKKGTGGGFQGWADSIEKASNGTLRIKFYPTGQLGPAVGHYDMARDGVADIAWAVPGYTPGRFPIISAAELPFVFKDGAGGSQAVDSWYRKYAPSEMKDVKYLLSHIHNPGTFYTKKKVVRPEDVKGLKVRASTGTMGKWINLLGGNAVFMPTSEAVNALKKGVADAETFAAFAAETWGHTKVIPHITDMRMYATIFVALMNKNKYKKLTVAQRKVIDDHATPDWARRVSAPWNKLDNETLQSFSGRKDRFLHAVSPAELARWQAASQPLVESWSKEVKKKTGLDPSVIMSELRASVRRYDP